MRADCTDCTALTMEYHAACKMQGSAIDYHLLLLTYYQPQYCTLHTANDYLRLLQQTHMHTATRVRDTCAPRHSADHSVAVMSVTRVYYTPRTM